MAHTCSPGGAISAQASATNTVVPIAQLLREEQEGLVPRRATVASQSAVVGGPPSATAQLASSAPANPVGSAAPALPSVKICSQTPVLHEMLPECADTYPTIPRTGVVTVNYVTPLLPWLNQVISESSPTTTTTPTETRATTVGEGAAGLCVVCLDAKPWCASLYQWQLTQSCIGLHCAAVHPSHAATCACASHAAIRQSS